MLNWNKYVLNQQTWPIFKGKFAEAHKNRICTGVGTLGDGNYHRMFNMGDEDDDNDSEGDDLADTDDVAGDFDDD